MPYMLQELAGLVRNEGPLQAWMVEKDKERRWIWMMEEAKHPGMDCRYLLSDWSSPQNTGAGC